MSKYRRKYSKDFKIELVESVLKGRSILELAKENEYIPKTYNQVEKAVSGR